MKKNALDPAYADAYRRLLALALVSGAAGISARSLTGLPGLLAPHEGTAEELTPSSVVPLPYPVKVKKTQQSMLPHSLATMAVDKQAQAPVGPPPTASSPIPASMYDVPGYGWLAPLAIMGGGYGGWKLMDHLVKKQRKQQLHDEVTDAKQEYSSALMDMHNQRPIQEMSGDVLNALRSSSMLGRQPTLWDETRVRKAAEKAASALLKMADGEEPQTVFGKFFGADPAEGTGAGGVTGTRLSNLYGLYATALSLLSGYGMYNYDKARSPAKLTEEAVRRRAREQWARRPTELTAVPVPIARE